MKRQRTSELVVDGSKKNESINILHTKYVERRHISIIFDDPSLRPEKILYPPEPVAIYPRPPDARTFLFTALPAPGSPVRHQYPYLARPEQTSKIFPPPARHHVAPRVKTRGPPISASQ